jgi:RNA-directed DNA polymerase
MTDWRPQHYRRLGELAGVDADILENAIAAGQAVIAVHPALPPILTLGHLAHLAEVDYRVLRSLVERNFANAYRVFRIRKRPARNGERRFRTICAPAPAVLAVQRWIASSVLSLGRPHSASTAYSKGSNIVDAARAHCGCRWLVKLDVKNFFESITEIAAYRVFRGLGYQPLVALELTRICTRLGTQTLLQTRNRWRTIDETKYAAIDGYPHWRMGHLPQGAPTSPMLANLTMLSFDEEVTNLAERYGLTYTRYADDIALSTQRDDFDRSTAVEVIGQLYSVMGSHGLSPNSTKTQVIPPGARKVVLGLLIDGASPRLTREFKAGLRMHLHFLAHPDIGPARHAVRRGFAAVAGLRNHLNGLVAYASQIEPSYAERVAAQLQSISWPL